MRTKKETSEGTSTEQEFELRGRQAKGNRLVIMPAVIVAIIGVSIYFAMAGCAEHNDINNIPIKAVWIEPQVMGDIVSVPVSEVENNRNIHFKVETQTGDMHFMAYILYAEIYVRANVCPPCRGIGYSLDGDILVCDTCATTFKAKTGDGIKGACVDFPKASVPYEIIDGSLIMEGTALIAAYEDTTEPGWP